MAHKLASCASWQIAGHNPVIWARSLFTGVAMTKQPKRKAGRPRLSDKGKGPSERIGVRCGADLLARLDKWRRGRKLGRSEAVRALTERGLTADGV